MNILFAPFFILETFGDGFLQALFIVLVILLVFLIVDCAKRKFKNDVEKIVWIIVLVFGSWIGLLAYYLVIVLNNPKGLAKK